MPIYQYRCDKCGTETEELLPYEHEKPVCCGEAMTIMPTFPAMVKIKGMGGYPSRRKQIFNTTARNKPKLS